MTTEYRDLVNKMFNLFSDPGPSTPEEIDTGLREVGYDPDEIGARMKVAAQKALLLTALDLSVTKVKAGLQYAASGKYQSYPPGILELGVTLDAIDMIVADIQHFAETTL